MTKHSIWFLNEWKQNFLTITNSEHLNWIPVYVCTFTILLIYTYTCSANLFSKIWPDQVFKEYLGLEKTRNRISNSLLLFQCLKIPKKQHNEVLSWSLIVFLLLKQLMSVQQSIYSWLFTIFQYPSKKNANMAIPKSQMFACPWPTLLNRWVYVKFPTS